MPALWSQCIICVLAIMLLHPARSLSQELHCNVDINYDQVSGVNSTFETLKQSISEYLNNTAFTDCQFSPAERIECQLLLVVNSYDNNTVSGELQIQSLRPVYNATYTTTVLNFKDNKIDFEYQEGDPLVFSATEPDRQLTALLDFYAYLILALDFDTFSLYGGEQYWDYLKRLTLQFQNSGYTGWTAFDDIRNRGAIVDAVTQPSTKVFRDLLYNYHRLGLDQMALSPEKGRLAIGSSLQHLAQIQRMAPMSASLTLFKDAKLPELVNIYSGAPQKERQNIYNLLQNIYPAENTILEKIRLGEK